MLLQVVDKSLHLWKRIDDHDSEHVSGEGEAPSQRDKELFQPLRQLIGTLQHLERLRIRGTTPFSLALSELPPLRVSDIYRVNKWN